MIEFIVNRLNGAESHDWMASRPALKKAIISSSLVMPELVDVVANILGEWPLIVLYLEEAGRKDVGDSPVVWSPSFNFCCPCLLPMYFEILMFRRRVWIGTFIWTSSPVWIYVASTHCLEYVSAEKIYCFEFPSTWAFRTIFPKISRNGLVWLPVGAIFPLPLNLDDRITLLVSLKSFQCLWRVFCFSCQHFCPSSVVCRLWVLRLWWRRPFGLLSSSEDQTGLRFAISWAVGGVHGS